MNTRPTPETDANLAGLIYYDIDHYHDSLSDDPLPWPDFARKLECERDEAREQGNDMREKWLAKGQCCEYLGAELHEAIKQRDRLAEALRECLERLEHHTEFGALVQADMSAMHSSRQALQSLTPNV